MAMMLAHAVDEGFERMAKLYGRQFTANFEGGDIGAIKRQWEHELAALPSPLDAIAWALKHLPERPPNAVQFVNLCRQMPSPQQQAMKLEGGGPVRGPTIEELAALRSLRDDIARGTLFRKPGREWAHEIIAKHERGENVVIGESAGGAEKRYGPVSGYAIRCAREAVERSNVPRETDPEPMATGKPEEPARDEWADFYDSEDRPC